MNFFTEELYKKAQLFRFPVEGGLTIEELAEEFELDVAEFLYEELMAHEEWYAAYLPESLKKCFFDEHGEVSFQEIDDVLMQEIADFRKDVERDWSKALVKAQQVKQKIWQTAEPEMRTFLKLRFEESEIHKVSGIDTSRVTMKVYPAWDMSKVIVLTFHGVKDGWMNRMHPDDADWWLADEIKADEEREGRYHLQILYGNAESVGSIQFSFQAVEILEQDDPFGC